MKKDKAIGLFDSGVGGLTVVREIFSLLPEEDILYFGDTAHVPYGSRKPEELISLADKIIGFLIDQGAKYIIFACNTNSSISLGILKEKYPVPMVGMVYPGAREAVQLTSTNRVGVVATEATVRSGAYERAIKSLKSKVVVFSQAAPRLVPLVESGKLDGKEAKEAINEYLSPLRSVNIDTLILGCSHYPFLSTIIYQQMGDSIRLVDPAAATVLEAKRELAQKELLNNSGRKPCFRVFVSGDPLSFQEKASLLGYPIKEIKQVCLD